jgi:hypothetical protein
VRAAVGEDRLGTVQEEGAESQKQLFHPNLQTKKSELNFQMSL